MAQATLALCLPRTSDCWTCHPALHHPGHLLRRRLSFSLGHHQPHLCPLLYRRRCYLSAHFRRPSPVPRLRHQRSLHRFSRPSHLHSPPLIQRDTSNCSSRQHLQPPQQQYTAPSGPQPRHSMSLNTISAPLKPALPTALVTASVVATPTARVAAVEQPAFPLPPTPAARNTPLPSPAARASPHVAAVPQPTGAAAAGAAGAAGAANTSALVAERGEAVHSFDATDSVQLSVSKGDALLIMQRLETGWTVCRMLHTGITGLVPTSYICSTTERVIGA